MLDTEKIIGKWQKLQRLIKEEITLSKIIYEDQKNREEKCQDWYYDYYQTKIQIDYQLKEKDFILHRNTDVILDDAFNPIYELLMRFRLHNEFIIKLIDIIEKDDYILHSSINDLIQFFCYQLYEDLFASNNNEVVLSLIHKMIIREIASIASLKPITFIDESTSFLGKFLKYFALKQDMKHFASIIFGGVILKINQNDKAFELNPLQITEQIRKTVEVRSSCVSVSLSRSSIMEEITNIHLTKSIKKSSFNIDSDQLQLSVSYKLGDDIFFQNKSNSNNIIFNTLAQIDEENKSAVFIDNNEYYIQLTEAELISRINNKHTSIELKEVYAKLIGLGNDYTNNVLIKELNSYKTGGKILLHQYRKNFNLIKDAIDSIFKNLINNIHSIPYSLRCICRMISDAITHKYPNMTKVERNSLIGEFFFKKCLINFMLIDHNSKKRKESCINISKVLLKISRCSLFSAECDSHYTIFNPYIIEIIPKLKDVYERLIDVDISNNVESIDESKKKICIVFPIEAIIMLNTILKEKKSQFEELPSVNNSNNSKFFTKTINRIKNQEAHLNAIISKSTKKNFCAIFNWERVPTNNNLETTIQLNQIENGVSNRVAQVKFCIKSILKNLNIVNKKIYSHLNNVNSNETFIFALKEIVDLEEYNGHNSDNYLKIIPLSWYSLYMISNLWKDDDDFESLYNELYDEEKEMFSILEKQYNENAIEMGVIEQCVNNKLQKNMNILIRKNNDSIGELAKKIIDGTPLALCIRRIEPSASDERETIREKDKKQEEFKSRLTFRRANPIISFDKKFSYVGDTELHTCLQLSQKSQCIHQRLQVMRTLNDFSTKKSAYFHTHTLKLFVNKLCTFEEVQTDISNGNNNHKVYQTIQTAIVLLENELVNPSPIILSQTQPQPPNLFHPQSQQQQITTKEIHNDKEEKSYSNLTPEEKSLLRDNIEDFILRKIHKMYIIPYLNLISVCLSMVLEKDTKLFKALSKLSYLSQNDLKVHKNSINETLIQLAADELNTLDTKMSPREKLKAIVSSFYIINHSVKFSLEKDDSNTLNPVVRYILLKASPKRLYCNINFIRAFTDPSKLRGEEGLMLYQLEDAASFFLNFEVNIVQNKKP